MSDTEQQELVDRFGRQEDQVRVLLCSDVASEGLNLHYFCHRLVHFDLPWSLMVFQQRNGRVDRYGQKCQPHITYLFTTTDVEKIKGDLRILEILETKDEQANKNLGDPGCFLNVYDAEKEEAKVAGRMAAGETPEAFAEELDANAAQAAAPQASDEDDGGEWFFNLFAQEADVKEMTQPSTDFIAEPPTLFGSERISGDYAFAKTALQQLSIPNPIAAFSVDDGSETITLTAPLDLQERLKVTLPVEARDGDHRYTLTAKKDRMAAAIEQARQRKAEEDTWPELHYLWPQHPILEWLSDRVLTAFGRHRAPVIQCPRLAAGEEAFLLMGVIPNRKGQPLLVEWRVAVWTSGSWQLEDFPSFAARAGLVAGSLSNPAKPIDASGLQTRLPEAVAAMDRHMKGRQETFAADLSLRLAGTLADLEKLQGRQFEQLELRFAASQQAEQFKRTPREQRIQHIRRVFDDYRQWVKDTMTTEPQPFLQVLAAVTR